jgi:hypothetical protein
MNRCTPYHSARLLVWVLLTWSMTETPYVTRKTEFSIS